MSKKNPGQKIMASCPSCHIGKLLVRIKHKEFRDGAIGARGTPDSDTIHELVCSNCCGKFAAENEGASIWPLIEKDLEAFQQPKKKPKTCHACHNDSLKDHATSLPSDDDDWGPVGGYSRHENERTRYLYCTDCLAVVYITQQPST
ncbi:MAG: hypothetical protein NTX72_02790 [Candidatus Uhrbacteria bacterium]|nr:hypothetical protein [Candidatus Uhrbacteria bacterium]